MRSLIFAALLLPLAARADPPPYGSDDAVAMRGYEKWIESRQQVVRHASCCGAADGRPLADNEIRVANGRYEILYSRRHWRNGDGKWIVVPDDAILPDISPLGHPIVWVHDGVVLCIVMAGAV